MKNWNKTGRIKAIILGILAFPNLFMPGVSQRQEGFLMILMPLIFGIFVIPLIAKFNEIVFRRELIKPTWNDNPLALKRPLSFFHFCSFFFLVAGLSMAIGTGLKFQTLSFMGLTAISFGFGILIGIRLTLKLKKVKA